jgi:hypothetical protein
MVAAVSTRVTLTCAASSFVTNDLDLSIGGFGAAAAPFIFSYTDLRPRLEHGFLSCQVSQCCSRRCRSTRCTARCCTTPTRTPFGERFRYHPSAHVPLLPHAHGGAPAGQGPGTACRQVLVVERVGAACSAVSGFLPICFALALMSSSISRALPVPLNPKPLNPKPLRNHNPFRVRACRMGSPASDARKSRACTMFACFRSTSVLEHARLDLLLPPRASRILLGRCGCAPCQKAACSAGLDLFLPPRASRILLDGAGARRAKSSLQRRQRCQQPDLV